MNPDLQKKVWSEVLSKASQYVDQANNPEIWAKNFLSAKLYSNQIQIINTVTNLKNEYTVVIGSRGSGKTWSVSIGLIQLAIENSNLEIGIFGPRADQATRIIFETKKILTNSPLHSRVNWDKTTAEKLVFNNGSYMLALSAAETSLQEGWHFGVIVVDEAHRVSNVSLTQRIIPMLGSKKIFKLIKIGIPLFKNHFYESYSDPKYKVIEHDWLNSPILLEPGYVELDGKKYPAKVLDRMPLSLKTQMFPNNPELHTNGDMSEIEFKTQYGMQWVDDANTFLSSKDIETLIGAYPLPRNANAGEVFYFGVDTSSGTLTPGKYDLDFTTLVIFRKTTAGVKEKVAAFQWQGGESLAHLEEMIQIVHPSYGLFPCSYGCIDYSNVGITAVELFKREKISVAGIVFSGTEPSSHKNYKNAMAEHFRFELQAGNIKYPKNEEIESHKVIKKHFYEWVAFEQHLGLGLNSRLSAPEGLHDDGVAADILCCWAADRASTFKKGLPTIGIPHLGIPNSIMASRPGTSNTALGRNYFK